MTCNYCQKPGYIRPDCPERQCFKCRGWGHEAASCPSKAQFLREEGGKEEESVVMVVNMEAFCEVIEEIQDEGEI